MVLLQVDKIPSAALVVSEPENIAPATPSTLHTDRQTNRQTDRQTDIADCYHFIDIALTDIHTQYSTTFITTVNLVHLGCTLGRL